MTPETRWFCGIAILLARSGGWCKQGYMSQIVDNITAFVDYAGTLDGDEKGEAQVFCDRSFRAFGHGGYKEAGATLEFRIKKGKTTSFADLIWKPRLLMEMKRRGEKLHLHYQQAFEYWINAVPIGPAMWCCATFGSSTYTTSISNSRTRGYRYIRRSRLNDIPPSISFSRTNASLNSTTTPKPFHVKRLTSWPQLFRNLTHRMSKPDPASTGTALYLANGNLDVRRGHRPPAVGNGQGIVDDCIDNGQSCL